MPSISINDAASTLPSPSLPLSSASPATSAPVATSSSLELYRELAGRPLIIAGTAFGILSVLIPIFFVCIFIARRRIRRRRSEHQAPEHIETETLLTVHSLPSPALEEEKPVDKNPWDIENPAPVYLGKSKAMVAIPHFKPLRLLSHSRTTSSASTTSTLVSTEKKGTETNPRILITQPSITHHQHWGNSSIYYKNSKQIEEWNKNFKDAEDWKKKKRNTASSALHDELDHYMAAFASPGSLEDKARRLSVISAVSTIRFARDSSGYAYRRASTTSDGPETVFDGESPPLGADTPVDTKRSSFKSFISRKRASKAHGKRSPSLSPPLKDIEEEIAYQPTPLAPPPVQIRSRSNTPNNMMSYDSHEQRPTHLQRPPGLEGNEVSVKGSSMSILHAAVAKGKISREEAEHAIGMRISMTP